MRSQYIHLILQRIFSLMTQLKEQKKVATARKTFSENKYETQNICTHQVFNYNKMQLKNTKRFH